MSKKLLKIIKKKSKRKKKELEEEQRQKEFNKRFDEFNEVFNETLPEKDVISGDLLDEINDLINGENPEFLFELSFSCHFNIGHEELMEMMIKANGNHVEKYTFIMEMVSERDYMSVFRRANLFYLNKEYKNSIDQNLPLLMKYNLFEKDKKNIAQKLIRFLNLSQLFIYHMV